MKVITRKVKDENRWKCFVDGVHLMDITLELRVIPHNVFAVRFEASYQILKTFDTLNEAKKYVREYWKCESDL